MILSFGAAELANTGNRRQKARLALGSKPGPDGLDMRLPVCLEEQT